MRQRGFTIALLFVLLAACVGGFFGGRYLIGRLQRDFVPGATWAPPTAVANGGAIATPAPGSSPSVARRSPTAPVIRTPAASRSPVAPAAMTETVIAESTVTVTPTPAESETPTATLTLVPALPFGLARSVRHTVGDCPGSPQAYILGQVTDRTGKPLAAVRLLLDDEYGNQAYAVSKSGQADAGRYDFPISGPPRRFFLALVDANGRVLSPRVEIEHGRGPNAQATCHWVDWQRQ